MILNNQECIVRASENYLYVDYSAVENFKKLVGVSGFQITMSIDVNFSSFQLSAIT